mgnify:CR=1 FL=1
MRRLVCVCFEIRTQSVHWRVAPMWSASQSVAMNMWPVASASCAPCGHGGARRRDASHAANAVRWRLRASAAQCGACRRHQPRTQRGDGGAWASRRLSAHATRAPACRRRQASARARGRGRQGGAVRMAGSDRRSPSRALSRLTKRPSAWRPSPRAAAAAPCSRTWRAQSGPGQAPTRGIGFVTRRRGAFLGRSHPFAASAAP